MFLPPFPLFTLTSHAFSKFSIHTGIQACLFTSTHACEAGLAGVIGEQLVSPRVRVSRGTHLTHQGAKLQTYLSTRENNDTYFSFARGEGREARLPANKRAQAHDIQTAPPTCTAVFATVLTFPYQTRSRAWPS